MKPAEYAKELGISRQAVYAKIKRGILQSKSVEGKLYIVVDNDKIPKETKTMQNTTGKPKQKSTNIEEYKALLDAKDETIAVLKETVLDLKESNNQISTTLRGEIDLLKDAFYEMRTLYAHQLEHKKQESIEELLNQDEVEKVQEEVIEIFTDEEEQKEKWIGIKKFFKIYNITKEKTQEKLTKRLKKAYKKGDKRLIKIEDKLKINLNKNYEDILD